MRKKSRLALTQPEYYIPYFADIALLLSSTILSLLAVKVISNLTVLHL
jgi:hypothetical protein